MNLRQTLYAWREHEAQKRSVDLFMILPNTAIEEIVRVLPETKEELTSIKGIKDAKFREYGNTIIRLVKEAGTTAVQPVSTGNTTEREEQKYALKKADISQSQSHTLQRDAPSILTVSTYLDVVNNQLIRINARIQGEVTQVNFKTHLYAEIKDKSDGSTMSFFMWATDYERSGIILETGMEIILEGKSEIYKPNGRFNFRTRSIELVGEGALKKAYENLKKKLTEEGLFLEDRKRTIKPFPERIGLITSRTGAVINDFLNNLGKFGFQIQFIDSRVEGVLAVSELLDAIASFRDEPLDALVVIRGGGSLESLQAFNNEHVVRAIANFPLPVICAIGHDKDVPLAQLVADYAPSTPTATTIILNESWRRADAEIRLYEQSLLSSMRQGLWETRRTMDETQNLLKAFIQKFEQQFSSIENYFFESLNIFKHTLEIIQNRLNEASRSLHFIIKTGLRVQKTNLDTLEKSIDAHSPLRQLALGYSIVTQKKKIVKSISEIKEGSHFEVQFSDGIIDAEAIRPNKHNP